MCLSNTYNFACSLGSPQAVSAGVQVVSAGVQVVSAGVQIVSAGVVGGNPPCPGVEPPSPSVYSGRCRRPHSVWWYTGSRLGLGV